MSAPEATATTPAPAPVEEAKPAETTPAPAAPAPEDPKVEEATPVRDFYVASKQC